MPSRFSFPRIVPEVNPDFPLRSLSELENRRRPPPFVRRCPVTLRILDLLGPLAWSAYPERGLKARGTHTHTRPHAGFVAAFLFKLNEGLVAMSELWRFRAEHPTLAWLLGFARVRNGFNPWRVHFQTQLPQKRHFNRILRTLLNETLQVLLTSSVHLLQRELTPVFPGFGQTISLDTKHILAWVKENNHKAYVKERYNPNR